MGSGDAGPGTGGLGDPGGNDVGIQGGSNGGSGSLGGSGISMTGVIGGSDPPDP